VEASQPHRLIKVAEADAPAVITERRTLSWNDL